jgi:uncharacterized membrane-anchored protein
MAGLLSILRAHIVSMKTRATLLTLSLALVSPLFAADEAAAPAAPAADVEQAAPEVPQIPGIEFQQGPTQGPLGTQAGVAVPDGYFFTGAEGTQKLMQMMQNPVSGNELGFLAPKGKSWFVVFEYDDTGYVSDAEKDKIDADSLLESFKKGTEAGNKLRQEKGWDTLEVLGWETAPAYNPSTQNLEWATRLRSGKGDLVINHNIRLLGREGVMSAVLVADPAELAEAAATTRQLLASGYLFNKGKTYAEFKKGDKIAEYGLMGLIAGGAAVVGAKTGLFKALWKLILIPVVAVGAWFKKLFKRNDTSTPA